MRLSYPAMPMGARQTLWADGANRYSKIAGTYILFWTIILKELEVIEICVVRRISSSRIDFVRHVEALCIFIMVSMVIAPAGGRHEHLLTAGALNQTDFYPIYRSPCPGTVVD